VRREEFNTLNEQAKELKKNLDEATQQHTNDELKKMIDKLQAENEVLEKKVDAFKSGGVELISEEVLNETFKEQKFYAMHWKKVKRGCKEMLDIISEQADINPKDFVKNLGLETDEDYGVNPDKLMMA
jgi:predicted nuclease with TOPRIM domain